MHKEISKIQLYTDGGLVIKFKDGDHTYICRHEMYEIIKEFKDEIIKDFKELLEEDE